MFSCEFCDIFKNTFFYRTPPVVASAPWKSLLHLLQWDPSILNPILPSYRKQLINFTENHPWRSRLKEKQPFWYGSFSWLFPNFPAELFSTNFSSVFHWYTPWKQKTKDFLTFLGGVELKHMTKMAWNNWIRLFCHFM